MPSRLHPGDFYVLPQSPQIAKQLLMVSGFDRYFQIARCMRDEDLRADRQFEFSQLDIEMSFVGGQPRCRRRSPTRCSSPPRRRPASDRARSSVMTWREAMERYGSDKPDLRFGMELVDLDAVLDKSGIQGVRGADTTRDQGPKAAPRSPATGSTAWWSAPWRSERRASRGSRSVSAEPKVELSSPLDRFFDDSTRAALVEVMRAEAGDLLLVVADEWRPHARSSASCDRTSGGHLRGEGAKRFLWVTEFPMFEGLDESGRPIAQHHPFTMPHPDDLDLMRTDPLAVRSAAYDLVLNGWELGSGSVRIHREDIQRLVFDALGISAEEAEARFGFLLGAFRYGAPPHAGFAVGVDRFVALLAGEENIREVIAFPKTQSGADLMTGAPRPLAPEALRDLHIQAVGGDLPDMALPGAASADRDPRADGPGDIGQAGTCSQAAAAATLRSPRARSPRGSGRRRSTRWSASGIWSPRVRRCARSSSRTG